jgi:hypothetical protein
MLCATTESDLQTDISSTGIDGLVEVVFVCVLVSVDVNGDTVVMVFCGSCCDVLVESFDNEGQIPNLKEETGKKISFGEVSQFSMKQSPDTTNDIQMTNVKETVTDDHGENRKGTNTE